MRSGRPGPEERSDTATSPDESWARWDAEALATGDTCDLDDCATCGAEQDGGW